MIVPPRRLRGPGANLLAGPSTPPSGGLVTGSGCQKAPVQLGNWTGAFPWAGCPRLGDVSGAWSPSRPEGSAAVASELEDPGSAVAASPVTAESAGESG